MTPRGCLATHRTASSSVRPSSGTANSKVATPRFTSRASIWLMGIAGSTLFRTRLRRTNQPGSGMRRLRGGSAGIGSSSPKRCCRLIARGSLPHHRFRNDPPARAKSPTPRAGAKCSTSDHAQGDACCRDIHVDILCTRKQSLLGSQNPKLEGPLPLQSGTGRGPFCAGRDHLGFRRIPAEEGGCGPAWEKTAKA